MSTPFSKRDVGVHSANDEHDPHRATRKTPEGTACPKCHASFHGGRWTWNAAPRDAHEMICPACHRIQDRFPGGYVTIKGAFFAAHRDEILGLIKGHEKKEKADRPLQRLMGIEEKRDGSAEVTTTDSLLARGIAEALHEAYNGDLKLRYSRDENLLRATWKR